MAIRMDKEQRQLLDSLKNLPERRRKLTAKEKAEAYEVTTNIDEGLNERWNSFMAKPEDKKK